MIKFKHKRLKAEWKDSRLRPDVKAVVMAIALYMKRVHGIHVIITSIFPEDNIERVSQSHAAGRAIDLRTKDWPSDLPFDVANIINESFSTGAYHENGEPMKVCVYHDSGYGKHFHIQVAVGQEVEFV